ncbi:class I adenylate-forming enzyme family protein [Paenibacillus sp. FJAT-26967]|uniref:class I adenylate-forming enzyme family protein n=1 Tax=Paenibacillus sp. FJAT-26967 TaxID=1729690 RepID=UPI000838A720|nr:class I adenylate-forming enzyme family protein [Paenibacillus sp. FJAT-26967]
MHPIAALLYQAAHTYSDQLAFMTLKHSWSYQQYWNISKKFSLALKDLPERSRIALKFNNGASFVTALFGTWAAGHIPVLIPFRATSKEVDSLIHLSECRAGWADQQHEGPGIWNLWDAEQELLLFQADDMELSDEELLNQEISEEQLHECTVLLPTSGSTGTPNLVMLTPHNLLSNAHAHGKAIGLTPEDRWFITMPASFSSVLTTQILTCLQFRVPLVLFPLPLFPRVLKGFLSQLDVTCFSGVPTTFIELLREPNQPLSRIRLVVVSGAQLTERLFMEMRSYFPQADILQTYGLTEASPRVSVMRPGQQQLHCGPAVEGVNISIVDSEGNELQPGMAGDVLVSGNGVMLGYYNNPELTRPLLANGRLRTGDYGYMDKEGNLHITGRKKNMFLIGGHNVFPEEIEQCLLRMESIEDAAVVSRPDELYGESILAYIKPRSMDGIHIKELELHCRKELSNYKVPKEWIFVEDMPKTGNGKLDRKRLKAMAEQADSGSELHQ